MEALEQEQYQKNDNWAAINEAHRNRLGDLKLRTRIKYQKSEKYFLATGDLVSLLIALVLGGIGFGLYYEHSFAEPISLGLANYAGVRLASFLGLTLVALASFWSAGHYSRRQPFWDELRATFKIILIMAMLDAALVFLGKWPFSRLWFISTWVLALMLVPVTRVIVKKILMTLGGWRRPTVIVGTGANAREAATALTSEHLMGFDVIAFIAGPTHHGSTPESIEIGERKLPVLFYTKHPWELLGNLNSPHLVIALEVGEEDEQRALMSSLGSNYRNVHVAPPVHGLPLYGTEVERFFSHEIMLLSVRNNLSRLWSRALKRSFDIVASSLLLVFLSPVLVFAGLRIWYEDRFPVIFSQDRVGRGGKIFPLYKFRSMVHNADEIINSWQENNLELLLEYKKNNFKLKDDPRITRTGKWLRAYSLDELPQLWNVLKGEMSMVGPRPLLKQELEAYGDTISLYEQTRPGITGLWQISGRSKTTFADRAHLDAWYVRNWSLWYDIFILLKTIKVVLKRDGAY